MRTGEHRVSSRLIGCPFSWQRGCSKVRLALLLQFSRHSRIDSNTLAAWSGYNSRSGFITAAATKHTRASNGAARVVTHLDGSIEDEVGEGKRELRSEIKRVSEVVPREKRSRK
jgi:hypothetical protein